MSNTCSNPKNKFPGPHIPETCTYCGEGGEMANLRKAFRYMYLTLGYYGTPYNYDPDNVVYHPVSGQPASGILVDGGSDAREAMEKAKLFCPNWEELLK